MQWTADALGGFTTGTPWLPLNDPERTNVAAQRADSGSLLALYRRLIDLRRRTPALRDGSLDLLPELPPQVLGFVRSAGSERILVVANMGDRSVTVDGPDGRARILASTGDRSGPLSPERVTLDPLEGIVARLR
jgi:alpha-glucosidase